MKRSISKQNLREPKLYQLHKSSFQNKEACEKASICGCFHCLQVFPSSEIKNWHEEKRAEGGFTALCPYCGIDSVIPHSKEKSFDVQILKEMQKEFFENVTIRNNRHRKISNR